MHLMMSGKEKKTVLTQCQKSHKRKKRGRRKILVDKQVDILREI